MQWRRQDMARKAVRDAGVTRCLLAIFSYLGLAGHPAVFALVVFYLMVAKPS
jgi:hypothetical protein